MPSEAYDALVIGGGPGGSTAATLLARAGRRVLLLEKERFPRFRIGESLLPYNRALFEELGVLPVLEAAGFPKKFGAQFHLGNGTKSVSLVFSNGCFTRHSMAFQVERATFDHLLLKHARASGVDAREGWTVTRSFNEGDQIALEARDERGKVGTFHGRFLVDASGHGNFTGNQEGLRVTHPNLKKIAIYAHFEGVALAQGTARNDTCIVRLENKWFWLIPISGTKTSVGCVMDQDEFVQARTPASELFTRACDSSSEMRSRMKSARAVTAIQTTTDFSYHNRRLVGPRLLRVGDAAGFMDPIFSAGVYLAMQSAKLAAQAILGSLAAGDDGAYRLSAYEKRVFRAMNLYWELVEEFYTTPFMELFLEPRPRFNLPDAIVAILAGELEGGWRLAWRRRLFFWLVKVQRRIPLVPRISFAETSEPPGGSTGAELQEGAIQARLP